MTYKPSSRQPSVNNKTSNKTSNKSYWLFGKTACTSALQNPHRHILQVLATAGVAEQFQPILLEAKVSARICQAQELEKLLPSSVHQGIAVQVLPLESPNLESMLSDCGQRSIILLLDQITDPQNVGAIMRSAAAFGVDAVITMTRHSAHESGTVAKAASGALEVVPLISVTNLSDSIHTLKKYGYWIFAMDGAATEDVSILGKYERVAIVLGSEGRGLRTLVSKNCDMSIAIKISSNMQSLNVSNACGIALFCATVAK